MTITPMPMEELTRRRLALFADLARKDEEPQAADEDESRVRLHVCADDTATAATGVRYQKCGGGRRVIRKSRAM